MTSSTYIVVASTCPVKLNATIRAADVVFGRDHVDVGGVDADSKVPEQPVGIEAGRKGAFNRIEAAEKKLEVLPDFFVGVENYIFHHDNGCWYDCAVVVVKRPSDGEVRMRLSANVQVNTEYVDRAREYSPHANTTQGFAKTVGACIFEDMCDANVETSAQDWYRLWHEFSREDAVAWTLIEAFRAFDE